MTGRLLALLAAALLWPSPQAAELPTVCTITVNSPDEKEAFRRHLGEDRYRFVELVERGRPDWLAAACRSGVRCDVVIVSGHYDGASEFFSDQLEVREHLPVAELERVVCSDACPALFSRVKEVYLFGCNTLNPEPMNGVSAEVVRSLVREGRSPAQALEQWRALSDGHGESSRDLMRQLFKDARVIYGFASSAPLGPVAAAMLERHLRAAGTGDFGLGRTNGRLLDAFAPSGMVAVPGVGAWLPGLVVRRDICQFADERQSDLERLAFVRWLLEGPVAEARMHLERIQRTVAAVGQGSRRTPEIAAVFERIRRNELARGRFLAFARDDAAPQARVQMVDLAHAVGWLSATERRNELVAMLDRLLERGEPGLAEVDLACLLNRSGELDGAIAGRAPPSGAGNGAAAAAVRACLGSADARTLTLARLTSPNAADVQVAQAYLRHRPVGDGDALRRLARSIVEMQPSEAQVRALESLGRHYLSDAEVTDALIGLFTRTPSPAVQAAVAGILIRADRRALPPSLPSALREHRRVPPQGEDIIDALLRRLESR